jgi:predicted solute-binding protein
MRLGRISYVNMAPVFYGLEADVEEVSGVPTELARKLLDGEIDLAPIPSIEYARNAEHLRILLPKAEIVPLEEEADAKLLIGDAALNSAFQDPTPHFDLGRLWLEKTGLPMVFAVWAAREPVVDGLLDLEHSFVASVRLARSEPERLALQASETYGYPPGFLARYFEKLRYSFGPRERAGLYTFLEMARDVGELDHVPELRFVREEVVA